jgi:hypothetical protein
MSTIEVIGERKPLDDRLKEQEADLFLLCGGAGSIAEKIYKVMKAAPSEFWDPWQHIFLVSDPGKLTDAEKLAWFGTTTPSEQYAVLRGPDAPKKVASSGSVSALLTDGAPDILLVVDAFLA